LNSRLAFSFDLTKTEFPRYQRDEEEENLEQKSIRKGSSPAKMLSQYQSILQVEIELLIDTS